VQFVLRHEKRRELRFAARDGIFGRAVLGRHPEVQNVDSVIWLEPPTGNEPERVLVRSAAALEVASYLGGMWRLAAIARLVPTVLRDVAYDFVARHRHDLGLGDPSCLVPTTKDSGRFLS
jgi:predicted DCC family thiol-disulfide oxidoreductase YuxK